MSDQRFARLKSDPRFRRPRKKQSKVVIDDRFKHVLIASKVDKKVKSGGVDKYGRPVSEDNDKDNLRRFYRLESEEETRVAPDYARGEVLLESSDEGDIQDDSDSGGVVSIGHHHTQPILVTGDAAAAEIDLDESSFADLDAQAVAYNESHPEIQQAQIKPTHRLAVVNLDWDHVRASHLYKICSSVVSPTALPAFSATHASEGQISSKRKSNNLIRKKIVSVRVYPSKFGQERMAREEKEGPPPEIFRKKLDAEEEITPQSVYEVGDGNDYDEDALRNYQLERLRYYYAIITCDTVDTAMHIHTELEGAELERSANVFDLSFVPDDMTFDDFCRDEATADSNVEFKAVDFVTDALRHSKVKLTWDDDDPERNRITRRTLTKAEIEGSDFKALLASPSSDSDSEAGVPNVSRRSKENAIKASRRRLRTLLLGGDDELPEGWSGNANEQGDVDMEITFTPGLSERKDHDESTLDKYQRKIREKRKKKQGKTKERTLEGLSHDSQDEFFDGREDRYESDRTSKPWAPPDSAQKPQMLAGSVSRPLSTPEELKLLVASDTLDAEPKHFNIKSVLKAEKDSARKRKNRKKSGNQDDHELQDDFSIDVKDLRFKALHDDHQYAIDPSNPQFMKTKSMTALLEERSRRQKELRVVDLGDVTVREPTGNAGRSLTSLVESVKRKSATLPPRGAGKRRKL